MVPGAIAGNISSEATTPSGNIFNEAMRGRPTRGTMLKRGSRAGIACRGTGVLHTRSRLSRRTRNRRLQPEMRISIPHAV
jgi:hypothetical protein